MKLDNTIPMKEELEEVTAPPAAKITTTADDSDDTDVEMSHSVRAGGFSQQYVKHEIPLIELKLENVTYAPMVSSAAAAPRTGKGLRKRISNQAKHKKQRVEILSNVTTTLRASKLTAWMGPSGSGKTSFISVAADLVPRDSILAGSRILVNGAEGRIPKRLVGVVWQDDLLLSNLTVEENIFYTARMKTEESISNDEVRKLVQSVMEELGLLHVRSSLVGSPMGAVRGISGGERKRVAVASELVVRPSLILLDEPTSGLDATTAHALMTTLKDLASTGHTIAVVIHQPRTEIYNMFDHLLLLSKGRVIFDGEPCKARAYLESCPSVKALPPETGIADWMMDIVIHDERSNDEVSLAKRWDDYGDQKATFGRATPRQLSAKFKGLGELEAEPKYNVGLLTQLRLLTQRTVKQQRGERITSATMILQLAYFFFTSVFWWRMPDTTAYIFTRNSLFFFILISQANGIVVNSVTVFQRERTLLRRERAKKMYAVSSFFLAKTVSDMTNNVLLPLLYGMVVYWTGNYRPTFVAYLKFIFAYYLTLSTAQSMGLWMSIAIPNAQLSLILAPPLTLFFMIMGGFYIPFSDMAGYIRWLSWLSFARYGYSAMLINEYSGRDVPCDPSGGGGTSISIGTSTQCPMPGEEVFVGMGLTGIAQYYWFNMVLLVALQLAMRFGAYVSLRRSR